MAYPQGPPPGYGGYPQPGYGGYPQPGYGGYGPAQQEHPQGTMILVLGILGVVGVCGILAPIAWYMGNQAQREVDARPGFYSNAGSIKAGRICGMIGTIIIGLAIAFYALIFVLIIAGGTASSGT